MKHFLFLLLLAVPQARADITIKHTQSASLKVDGAAIQAIRVPSTYAVSGNNMKVTTDEHFAKLTAGTATTAPTLDLGVYEMNTVGSAFSFEESWLQGDPIPALGSGIDVTSGVVSDLPAFGNVTVSSGGVASDLAGSVLSSGVISITAGGAGTTATAQSSSEINVN